MCAAGYFEKCVCGAGNLLFKEDENALEQLKEDERVGVTFDLYDLGLLFFDKTKIKQHYIVNF